MHIHCNMCPNSSWYRRNVEELNIANLLQFHSYNPRIYKPFTYLLNYEGKESLKTSLTYWFPKYFSTGVSDMFLTGKFFPKFRDNK